MPNDRRFQVFEPDDGEREPAGERYLEFLRVPDMSAGVYRLAADEHDPQQPHAEDELYVVLAGRATMVAGDERRPVGPGSVAYVPAEVPHRFTDITDDLRVVVVFAPPESRPTSASS
ncbi:cupin domain-containing protein [Streptomyces sp. 8N706]|uniref:cupin domain-containing protein n=1 Tax=Streptomyces sp. 8N706 TaxID=3457416 RepID=UPI003FD69057